MPTLVPSNDEDRAPRKPAAGFTQRHHWPAWPCLLFGLLACDVTCAAAEGSAKRAAAATFYVRVDGGTAAQCSGRTDAAYPGHGSGQACAWNHPFVALPPAGKSRLGGGDTLIIGPGSYMMGLGAPDSGNCNSAAAYSCTMASIPSGLSAQQPTRILGQGFNSGCAHAPQLWGTQRAYSVVSLTGSSNVEVGCLDVTDHSSCIENHCGMAGACHGEVDRCERDTYPYGTWAENGLVASDSHDVYLHDLEIHGLANDGVRAGRLTNWKVDRVRIVGNGFAGWDGDIGNGDKSADTSNHGTLRFRHGEIGFNGCGERYPGREIYGCWGQEEGGYGDGLGTGRTSGNWVFEDMYVHHNTQDGLDLLYADGTGSVTLQRVRAEGNAGNQLKVAGTALIEDSNVVGDCAYFSNPHHVGAGNMQASDACRASGDAIAVALIDGQTTEIRNSSVTGQGGCLITGAHGGPTAILKLTGNVLTGQPRWDDSGSLACAHYLFESKATLIDKGNRMSNVKETAVLRSTCPDDSAHPTLSKACRAFKKIYRDAGGEPDAGDTDK